MRIKYSYSRFVNAFDIFCPYFPNIGIQIGFNNNKENFICICTYYKHLKDFYDRKGIRVVSKGTLNYETCPQTIETIKNNLKIYHDET
jgi:hypothetical protein